MTFWSLPITCLQCGDDLEHVNHASNGVLAVSIGRCTGCGRSYELTTRMRVFQSDFAAKRMKQRKAAA